MTLPDVQTAIYERLADYKPLTDLLAEAINPGTLEPIAGAPAIYDHVPQPESGKGDDWFPYVVIGEDDINQWDTDTSDGYDLELMVHVWDRSLGRLPTKEMQSAIHKALHRHKLALTDADTVFCHFQFGQTLMDPDGKTRHGIQRFRLVIDNVE